MGALRRRNPRGITMEKQQAVQEESKTEGASNTSRESELNAYLDEALKAARDERKLWACDMHNVQLSQIRQSIYISATIGFAVAGLIVLTPYWGGHEAALRVGPFIFSTLCFALAACVGTFIYGAFCLRGESSTIPLADVSYIDRVDSAWAADGDHRVYESKVEWLAALDETIREHREATHRKGKKIRTLNLAILCAAVVAAVGAAAAFSTTLLEKYVDQRAAETAVGNSGPLSGQPGPHGQQ